MGITVIPRNRRDFRGDVSQCYGVLCHEEDCSRDSGHATRSKWSFANWSKTLRMTVCCLEAVYIHEIRYFWRCTTGQCQMKLPRIDKTTRVKAVTHYLSLFLAGMETNVAGLPRGCSCTLLYGASTPTSESFIHSFTCETFDVCCGSRLCDPSSYLPKKSLCNVSFGAANVCSCPSL